MVITSHSIDIERPLPEVFAFLNSPQNFRLWQGNLVSLTATDGMNEGSIITFHSLGLGREFELEARVTVNNGRDRIEAVSSRGPLTFTSRYQLDELPTGTRVHLSNEIQTHGIFNLAATALQAMGETKYQADLQQLKIALENRLDSPASAASL